MHFPDSEVHPISEFFEEGLTLRAANRTTIQLDGVIILELCLKEGGESVLIPVIVTEQDMIEPILGYNVIEHLILESSPEEKKVTSDGADWWKSVLSGSFSCCDGGTGKKS